MKCAIIVNPKAGGGNAYRSISRYVDRWSHPEWDVELLETSEPNQAGKIALELIENPPDLLAVCGGDGTLNEVATAMPAPPFPVAVLPGGTANVVAKELKMPGDTVQALKIALNCSSRKVDLGDLDFGRRRRFVFVAGIGFDAYVAAGVPSRLKKALGISAYVLAGLRCLYRYPFDTFQVIADGREMDATTCIVSNARRYGGGLIFCPEADMQDGLLDVLIIDQRDKFQIARFFFSVWLGRTENLPWIHRLQARTVSVTGPEDIPIQVDGELAGTLPVDITLLPSTFPLVVP